MWILFTYSFFSTEYHVIQHEELMHIEQDPGEMTNEEEDDNA